MLTRISSVKPGFFQRDSSSRVIPQLALARGDLSRARYNDAIAVYPCMKRLVRPPATSTTLLTTLPEIFNITVPVFPWLKLENGPEVPWFRAKIL